jgi:hypothetical protein
MRRGPKYGAIIAAVAAIGVATSGGLLSGAPLVAAAAGPGAKLPSGCTLANGIQHVIEITFDNVHFFRDNPNVLSDIEQMPALMQFMTGNGTVLSNDHTPLIAHTANDTITNYSGLYGDRNGIPIANDYEMYRPSGTVASESAFAYWTGRYGVDAYPNQAYSPVVPATGQPPQTPPAPWVPYTRAGCNVGTVSTSNMELENLKPDLANVFGPNSPEVAQYKADPNSFKDQENNDYLGLGVHCARQAAFCATAGAVKYGQSSISPTAVADRLPNEPSGYSGFQALFGSKYLTSQLVKAANSGGNRIVNGHTYPVFDSAAALTDLTGAEIDGEYAVTPGFPGFGPISAAQSLAYVADMQETGVPVTYAYISDIHGSKPSQTGCSSPAGALGPGDTCDQANAAAYNQAFANFFQRLADDGITPSNALFIFSADEGDHFAGANVGRAVTPSCTGTPGMMGYSCTYTGTTIGEQAVNIHGLLKAQESDAIPFYNEPQGNSVYITGNPAPTSSTTRQLERDFTKATANDAYDGNVPEKLAQYIADPTVEQLLHFTNADANRTPSFTVFPKPDYYLSSGTSDKCPAGTTATNAAAKCSSIDDYYSWNHGYYAPEVNDTWFALVGPGVKHVTGGVDGPLPAAGPNSSGTANSNPRTGPSLHLTGTWVDHTDIRPTIMALTGLKDDYVTDGRVVTEDLTITPGQTSNPEYQPLAACYKQLNSSVGEFGTSVLVADTKAIQTGTASDDSTYAATLSRLGRLGAQRDVLAGEIKGELFGAAFDNVGLPSNGADQVGECQSLIGQAEHLSGS